MVWIINCFFFVASPTREKKNPKIIKMLIIQLKTIKINTQKFSIKYPKIRRVIVLNNFWEKSLSLCVSLKTQTNKQLLSLN